MLVAMMWKYSVQQITAYGIVFLFGISAPLPLGIQVKKTPISTFSFFSYTPYFVDFPLQSTPMRMQWMTRNFPRSGMVWHMEVMDT